MDMSAGYAKSVKKEGHAPRAVICYDPFHCVTLATKALDAVRRAHWQEMRRADKHASKRFTAWNKPPSLGQQLFHADFRHRRSDSCSPP